MSVVVRVLMASRVLLQILLLRALCRGRIRKAAAMPGVPRRKGQDSMTRTDKRMTKPPPRYAAFVLLRLAVLLLLVADDACAEAGGCSARARISRPVVVHIGVIGRIRLRQGQARARAARQLHKHNTLVTQAQSVWSWPLLT